MPVCPFHKYKSVLSVAKVCQAALHRKIILTVLFWGWFSCPLLTHILPVEYEFDYFFSGKPNRLLCLCPALACILLSLGRFGDQIVLKYQMHFKMLYFPKQGVSLVRISYLSLPNMFVGLLELESLDPTPLWQN